MIDYFKLVEGDALPLSPQPDPQPDTGEDLDACPAVGNCPDARPRVREFSRPSLAPRSDADDEGRGVNVKEDDMNRLEKVLYTARVHTTGGRAGVSRSSDGRLEVRLSRPGSPGTGTNPEQLLAAGWSACFESAMEFAARNMKITLPADHAVDAEIDLGPEGGAFSLAARLYVSLPGMERATAQRLVEAAHQVCPYSRATHGNIAVETTLV